MTDAFVIGIANLCANLVILISFWLLYDMIRENKK
jgi:hypothetical protein